jgi:hypothetical protein
MMPPQGALKPTEQERGTLVTWLEFAIINQHNDLAALLLEKGADPMSRTTPA